jgi:hypothetical protein
VTTVAPTEPPPLKLARKRRLSERQLPWLLLSSLGLFGVVALVYAVENGDLEQFEGFDANLRGYTVPGVALGIGALGACLLTFFYSLRKRTLQEYLPLGRGTLAGWLWGHVYFGVMALVFALAHAGYGTLSAELTSGKLLLGALALLVVGGLAWRLIYAIVPASAAREVGNYSHAASRARAEACLIEIEKIAAGRSPRFRQLTAWVLERLRAAPELAQALASLPPEERDAFAELARLAGTRHEAIERGRRQTRYLHVLQGLRVVHVPLGVLFVLLIPLHVFFAYDLPARAFIPGKPAGATLGFEPASSCAGCHQSIYEEWRHSMHAHAMTSPVMIAQTNQVAARVLGQTESGDLKEICVNCHGPVGALVSEGNTLPLPEEALSVRAILDDGISCAACHQWQGESHTGGGGLARFQDGLRPGRTFFGPFANAVGNAFHRSEKSAVFDTPEQLCRNCHSVQYDKNGDGRFDRGTDLVLQTLFDEWEAYRAAGGASCLDCHMPVASRKRSAENADVPSEQDRDAPDRVTRSHAFVAVDYPLDDSVAREAHRARRETLLRAAGTLEVSKTGLFVKPGRVDFSVRVANSGTGHNLPGGFAFVRQMWLEVVVEDASGAALAQSGRLASAAADLCDSSILDDTESPMRPFVQGCASADPNLVSFQQMLVDRVAVALDAQGAPRIGSRGERLLEPASGAKETILQHLDGGPVPRVRPSTKKPTAPLAPGESATFPYSLPFSANALPKRLRVRLLFRVTPPYFLRALAKEQAPSEATRLETLIPALEITEMAQVTLDL